MLSLFRPDEQLISRTMEASRGQQLTYSDLLATVETRTPAGFSPNYWKSRIGTGMQVFRLACSAIDELQMLKLGWLSVVAADGPPEVGRQIATLARSSGIWSLNVARVVAVDNETEHRHGFCYGTLPEYPVSGEERFTVACDPDTLEVTFEVFSFSRPAAFLAKAGWPLIRRAQRQFCRDAATAMRNACKCEPTDS